MITLCLRNRQQSRAVDLRLLRQTVRTLLRDLIGINSCELGIHLITPGQMACMNEAFLQHTGSTDVITFNHDGNAPDHLHGEIFISVDDAIVHSRQFRTTWQSELARYVVHGVLHLRGYDDLTPGARRKMKREEGRLLRILARRFALSKLERRPTLKK